MTISGTLSNALSGLRAAGRGAEVVSNNISNALTPGYGRRELDLSAAIIGDSGGVRVAGVTRIYDQALAADRREAEAEQGSAQLRTDFLAKVEDLLGTPDNPASFTARLAGFENGLITAASRPDAPERLSAAISDAQSLATSMNTTARGIQEARGQADRAISVSVDRLNADLRQMAELNTQITALQVQGGDAAALQDLRSQVVDRIGALVPVRQVPRDNGQVGLYTTGGAVLIDGTPVEIGFTAVNVVTPYMSVEAGTLSGLTLNGTPVRTDSEKGALRGGTLGAQFAIRDELAPAAQRQIDALARDLVERFQDPARDPTLGVGDAGLLTDAGVAFDPMNEVGLAERLQVNAAVDPDQGGEAWRLRDGINAAAPGNVGDATILRSLKNALTDTRVPASGDFGGGAYAAISLASALTSDVGNDRTNTERTLTYASARLTELTERQLADGVDSDAEIQRLLLIEQAFAANARVIQTADELIQQILRI